MPPIAAEIIRKCENPNTEVSALIQLISRDAALAVRVLNGARHPAASRCLSGRAVWGRRRRS
jgi:HD-like signal output (HDOD) protein